MHECHSQPVLTPVSFRCLGADWDRRPQSITRGDAWRSVITMHRPSIQVKSPTFRWSVKMSGLAKGSDRQSPSRRPWVLRLQDMMSDMIRLLESRPTPGLDTSSRRPCQKSDPQPSCARANPLPRVKAQSRHERQPGKGLCIGGIRDQPSSQRTCVAWRNNWWQMTNSYKKHNPQELQGEHRLAILSPMEGGLKEQLPPSTGEGRRACHRCAR